MTISEIEDVPTNRTYVVSFDDAGATERALVAREYGLPAVVSVPKATRQIEIGQRVRIDGTQGTVEIIEDDR